MRSGVIWVVLYLLCAAGIYNIAANMERQISALQAQLALAQESSLGWETGYNQIADEYQRFVDETANCSK